jgi:hypothetical protein
MANSAGETNKQSNKNEIREEKKKKISKYLTNV